VNVLLAIGDISAYGGTERVTTEIAAAFFVAASKKRPEGKIS
jgi:hypothetical protein